MDESNLTMVLAALVLVVAFSSGPSPADWLPGLALIPLASKVPLPL